MGSHQYQPAGPSYETPLFDGDTFEPEKDAARLGKQLRSVFDVMKDGEWRSLGTIANAIQYATASGGSFEKGIRASEASISARLRDFRKAKFGGHTVERRRVNGGLFEYRLQVK